MSFATTAARTVTAFGCSNAVNGPVLSSARTSAVSRPLAAIAKYLERYAEPGSLIDVPECFANAVAIPALGEGVVLHRAIASVPGSASNPTLLVVVLNHRADASTRVKTANRDAAKQISQTYQELQKTRRQYR